MKIKLTKQLMHTLTEPLKCDIALEWINVFKITNSGAWHSLVCEYPSFSMHLKSSVK